MLGRQIVKSLVPMTQAVQRRGVSVISGPPQNRVPFAEKAILGLTMVGSLLFIPSWVLFHIQEYKGHK